VGSEGDGSLMADELCCPRGGVKEHLAIDVTDVELLADCGRGDDDGPQPRGVSSYVVDDVDHGVGSVVQEDDRLDVDTDDAEL